MEITVAQVDDVRSRLLEMPPLEEAKRKLTLQQAIARMAGELAELQRRGYSIDDIANILRATGVEISSTSLKTYLSRARNTSKPRRKQASTPATRNAQKRTRELAGAPTNAQAVDRVAEQGQPGAVTPSAAPGAAHQPSSAVTADTSDAVTRASTPAATAETIAASGGGATRAAHGVDRRVEGEVDGAVDRGVDSAKDRPKNHGADTSTPAPVSASGGAPRDGAGDARQDRAGGPATAVARDQPQPVARSSSFVPRADSPNI